MSKFTPKKPDPSKKIVDLSPEQRATLLNRVMDKLKVENLNQKQKEASIFAEKCGFALQGPGAFASLKPTPLVDVTKPGPTQIQVRAKALSLNFRDLMIGLGIYPTTPGMPSIMGSDYAGEVIACGDSVTDYKIGDEVIGLFNGYLNSSLHFHNVVNLDVLQVTKKPTGLSFIEACCIPTVFLTAYFAICYQGQLKKEETILIHTASGGLGHAAIEIAKWKQAKILAAAGTEDKRAYLRSLGIKNPMSSRSTQFATDILQEHGGIDVIFNTLSGESIEKGMSILNPFGRFVQLDKTDIYQENALNMKWFKQGNTFSFVDLSLFEQNNLIQKLFMEVGQLFEKQQFHALPYTLFEYSDVGSALQLMSQAKYIGKIVLNCD